MYSQLGITTLAIQGLMYADSQFVAVGDSGLILVSPRDANFTSITKSNYYKSTLATDFSIVSGSPKSKCITLDFNGLPPSNLSIAVYKANGRKVTGAFTSSIQTENRRVSIPLPNLSPGMYILSIRTNLKMLQRVFLIM
jgi:hypothetical protein